MILIKHPVTGDSDTLRLERVAIRVDRFKLLKRRWRGKGEDGCDFGFELDEPLKHGDCCHRTETREYVIEQEPESVLEVDFAGHLFEGLHVAWSIGNLHMPMQSLASGVRVADDPAVRQLFAHLSVHYHEREAVFEPIRNSTEIGHSHSHAHHDGHEHSHGDGHGHSH
jgi:urease accessory protein